MLNVVILIIPEGIAFGSFEWFDKQFLNKEGNNEVNEKGLV